MSKRAATTDSLQTKKRGTAPVIDLTGDDSEDDECTNVDNNASSPCKSNGAEIFVLLDTSASMHGTRLESAVHALKDVMRELMINPMHKNDAVTFTTFNGYARRLFRKACVSLREDDGKEFDKIKASGGTALWDTVKKCIVEQNADQKVFLHCITDGQDTRSRATQKEVESLLEKRRDTVTLNIVFIGSDSDEAAESYASVAQHSQKTSIVYTQSENLAQQSLTSFSQMY